MSPRVVLVTAGTGPVEVRRFVAQLAEHLAGYCEARGARVSEVVARGDEGAPLSVEIHMDGDPAVIEGLSGTHALVARSEDRGKRSRKRWFAGVSVFEVERGPAAGGGEPSIRREDVTITAMRAGGPGGQHVNKTSSAVRVFHAESGVVVRAAGERSQRDNVRAALLRISAIVAEMAASRARGAKAERRLSHYRVERGRAAFVYSIGRDGGFVVCDGICSR